jgi:catalase
MKMPILKAIIHARPLATLAVVGLGLLMPASPASSQDTDAEAIVDSLSAVAGRPPMVRASNAKGICVRGSFQPTADARAFSKASIFVSEGTFIGRYALGGGNPHVPDTTKAVTRGFSMRLDHPDGEVALTFISAPMFFARTVEQMLGFLHARMPGADGKPNPEAVAAFAAANPETKLQAAWLNSHPFPASFAGVNYWAVQPYTFTNGSGQSTTVKLKVVPAAGELTLTEEEVKSKAASFYADELRERLAKGPARFALVAIIGEQGDVTSDSTAVWPEDERRHVELGTIDVSAVIEDPVCNAFTFDPVPLPEGMAGPADDPLWAIRSPAYTISLSRRTE